LSIAEEFCTIVVCGKILYSTFMTFILIVGGVVLLMLVLNLRGRVEILEQMVQRGVVKKSSLPSNESEQSLQPRADQPEVQGSSIAADTQVASRNSVVAQAGPTTFDRFIEWLKEDWLLKLGAMLLLIGFGWLATYAFLNNWIGPVGRIVLGIVAGSLFLLLGWWRMKTYVTQGSVFLVLGSTTILLTIFAARTVYDFFTPLSALAIMFLSTAFVAFASVTYRVRALALLSLALAGIAPLLTKAPTTDYVMLFAYLFVVVLGAIWIVVVTGQRELTLASLIIVFGYSIPHVFWPFSSPLGDNQILLLFAFAFAALFFVANTVSILKAQGEKILPDLIAAGGNGLLLLAWVMAIAQDEWKSLIIAAWMIVFAVGGFLVFRITQRREPLFVYAGVSIAMLAAATSAELEGATLTIAYIIESSIIAFVAYMFLQNVKIAQRVSLLLIGPVVLSFESMTSHAWGMGVFHKDFFVLFVLGLSFLGLGAFFLQRMKEMKSHEERQFNALFLIVGSVYAYILLWLSLHAALDDKNIAVMISLFVYTVVGLIAYFYGLARNKKWLRLYGGALVGLVVGRLLVVDVWKMEIAGRIITFFLIGTLLVSTAFLGRRKQDKAISDNI
jgi:uncharacterized membrane protein